MGLAAFQKGALIEIDGKRFRLIQELEDHLWQMENLRTGRIQEMTFEQMQRSYVDGHLIFVSDAIPSVRKEKSGLVSGGKAVGTMPTTEIPQEVKFRRLYVMNTLNFPATKTTLDPVIKSTWEKLGKPSSTPPSFATVCRWRSQFISSGNDAFSLQSRHGWKGNFKRKVPDRVIEIVESAVDTHYMTRERKTMEDTLDHACVLVSHENKLRPEGAQLPQPTRNLIRTAIEAIPAFDRYAARYGRTAAVRKFRAVLGHRMTEEPLQRAEIDHLNLDLMVIDDDTLLPLGRPWYTGCEDDFTRCQLGMNIGFQPPSHLVVARCLKHAFLPKVGLRDRYPEIKNEWLAHGLMQTLVVDNGLEFHGEGLDAACYALGIEIEYSPRKTPWHKGKIERYFSTLNDGVAHGQPGTTFSDIFEKDDYDPAKHAVIRLSTLRKIIHLWIADVYHQKDHRALGVSPAAMWKSYVKQDEIPLPDDPGRLDAILGRIEYRKLTHKGIELNGLLYNSIELAGLCRTLGDKLDVVVRADDGDLGHIWVFSPDMTRMFRVPALHFEYANGLTAWQHRVCKQLARKNADRSDTAAWRDAKALIARLVREDLLWKRKGTNSLLARYQEDCTPKTMADNSVIPPQSISASGFPVAPIPAANAQTPPDNAAAESGTAPASSCQQKRTSYEPIIESGPA